MKKYLLQIIFAFTLLNLDADIVSAQITFQKTLPVQSPWSNFRDYLKMKVTRDGGSVITIMAGVNVVSSNIVKLDMNGNSEWGVSINGLFDILIADIFQTSDNGYIACGYYENVNQSDFRFMLLKIDSTGHLQWKKMYGDHGFSHALAVIQTSDGGYLTVGDYSSSGYQGVAFKTDSLGDVEWTQQMYFSPDFYPTSIVEVENGNYLIGGFRGYPNKDWGIVKLSHTGFVIWKRLFYGNFNGNFNDETGNVLLANDGTYIASGSTQLIAGEDKILLMNLDTAGNILWSKTYGNSNPLICVSVDKTHDNGYVLTGRGVQFNSTRDMIAIKTDSIGNQIWSKFIGSNSFEEYGKCISELPNNGFIICGSKNLPTSSYNDIYLVSTDSTGNGICYNADALINVSNYSLADSTLPFQAFSGPPIIDSILVANYNLNSSGGNLQNVCFSVNTDEDISDELTSIFPNPSNGTLTILTSVEIKSIQLYDSMSRLIYENSNPINNTIELAGILKGVYFMRITSGDKLILKKIIVE